MVTEQRKFLVNLENLPARRAWCKRRGLIANLLE